MEVTVSLPVKLSHPTVTPSDGDTQLSPDCVEVGAVFYYIIFFTVIYGAAAKTLMLTRLCGNKTLCIYRIVQIF